MHGWICKSCGNRILENEPDEHNEDCPMQVLGAIKLEPKVLDGTVAE